MPRICQFQHLPLNRALRLLATTTTTRPQPSHHAPSVPGSLTGQHCGRRARARVDGLANTPSVLRGKTSERMRLARGPGRCEGQARERRERVGR